MECLFPSGPPASEWRWCLGMTEDVRGLCIGLCKRQSSVHWRLCRCAGWLAQQTQGGASFSVLMNVGRGGMVKLPLNDIVGVFFWP